LVWLLVVASFRELTNEGRTRLQTLGFVGVPLAVIVLVWSFVSESRANKAAAAAEQAAADALVERALPGAVHYPVPVLVHASAVELTPLSHSGETEVLDG
jgi:type VI protein secretion system component VasK